MWIHDRITLGSSTGIAIRAQDRERSIRQVRRRAQGVFQFLDVLGADLRQRHGAEMRQNLVLQHVSIIAITGRALVDRVAFQIILRGIGQRPLCVRVDYFIGLLFSRGSAPRLMSCLSPTASL
jgi:hypothetical protein